MEVDAIGAGFRLTVFLSEIIKDSVLITSFSEYGPQTSQPPCMSEKIDLLL